MPKKLEERIRARAHRLWEEEGRPEGRAHVHWEQARTLVAIEDDKSTLKPAEPPAAEPAGVMENLGEFPTAMTDTGDRQQFPKPRASVHKPASPKPAAMRKSSKSARKPRTRSGTSGG